MSASDIIAALEARGLTVRQGEGISPDGRFTPIKAGPCTSAIEAEKAWLSVFDATFQDVSGTVLWWPSNLTQTIVEVKRLPADKATGKRAAGWYAYGKCVVVPGFDEGVPA